MKSMFRLVCISAFCCVCNRLYSYPHANVNDGKVIATVVLNLYDSILQNIRQVQWDNNISNITNTDGNSTSYKNSQLSDGSWSDINYASTTQTSWNPLTHLNRLKTMALSASFGTSSYFNNESLCKNIEQGMKYWYDQDPRSSNWYNQQIASPKLVGEILILLRGTSFPIRATLEDSLLNRMVSIGGSPSNSYSVSGSSNKINIACHWIYRGCLTENSSVLKVGVDSAFGPIKIEAPSLGVQVDYSYQEHNNQLYIANYGTVFIDNVSNVALYTKGTKYELSGAKLDILSKYSQGIFMRSMRGNYSTFSATGRQISNKNKLRTSNAAIFSRMRTLDAANASVYDSAILRLGGTVDASYGVHSKNLHYWISDYTTHIRPGYSFDVRTVSTRTTRTEQVNSENLKGHFLPDGATNIQLDGDEYLNVFPSWDWARVPGTTTPHYATLPNLSTTYYRGSTSFVGGASDSLYGVNTYDMSLTSTFNVKAKKAWFYFDKEIVCLGAGIQSSASEAVNTTVNQCLQKGVVSYNNGTDNTFSFGSNSENLGSVNWVLHNKVGYVFPGIQTIGISNESRSGNWYTIATSQTNETVSNNVFALWINHGSQPTSAKYAYIVVPNMASNEALTSYIASSKVSIESNNDTLQCVYNREVGLWEMVAYQGNVKYSTDSFRIWADNPCVMMFRRSVTGVITGHISDPTQSLSNIQVYATIGSDTNIVRIASVALPSGSSAGSTTTFAIDNTSQVAASTDDNIYAYKYLASEDTYVDQANATYNYGQSGTLVVKKNSSTTVNNRESYIKFLLSDITLDPSQIQSVKLKLRVKTVNEGGLANYNWIAKYLSNDAWTAGQLSGAANASSDITTGLTWTNSRTLSTSSTVTLASTLGWQPAETDVYFDVTSQFLSELKNDKILSLQIYSNVGDSKGDASFYSLETAIEAARPQLIINTLQNTENALPISIVSFNGQKLSGNKIRLDWQLSEFKSIKGIQVLRSIDGVVYSNVGMLEAPFASSTFQFVDAQPNSGMNYYKLIISNMDQEVKNSEVISINLANKDKGQVMIYPNPARSVVYVLSTTSDRQLSLVGLDGKIYNRFKVVKGVPYSVKINQLVKGIYYIVDRLSGSVEKFVVAN